MSAHSAFDISFYQNLKNFPKSKKENKLNGFQLNDL
jgi:hypothetical protein